MLQGRVTLKFNGHVRAGQQLSLASPIFPWPSRMVNFQDPACSLPSSYPTLLLARRGFSDSLFEWMPSKYLMNLQASSFLLWFGHVAHVSAQLKTYFETEMKGVIAQNNTLCGTWAFPYPIWAIPHPAPKSNICLLRTSYRGSLD